MTRYQDRLDWTLCPLARDRGSSDRRQLRLMLYGDQTGFIKTKVVQDCVRGSAWRCALDFSYWRQTEGRRKSAKAPWGEMGAPAAIMAAVVAGTRDSRSRLQPLLLLKGPSSAARRRPCNPVDWKPQAQNAIERVLNPANVDRGRGFELRIRGSRIERLELEHFRLKSAGRLALPVSGYCLPDTGRPQNYPTFRP